MSEQTVADKSGARRSVLERVLGLVTEVRAGEGVTALLMTVTVFLLLTAYYILKPVREALILAMESGAEYKSYMSGAIAITLLFAVPAYARVADRLPRNRLVVGVTLFFVSHLVLFYFGSAFHIVRDNIGLIFFVWIGVFSMMVVAQFWAFANDLYTEDQGKRLFVLIGLGQALGAVAGAFVARLIVETLGVYQMLLVAGGVLVVCAGLVQLVHTREARRPAADEKVTQAAKASKSVPKGAYELVFRVRYLLLLAAFSTIFTFVNTNGEYMLGTLISDAADAAVASGEIANESHKGEWIGAQFAEFYLYVNILTFVLQTFVVSRLLKYGGLRIAFFVLPLIAFLDASAVAIVPLLGILFIGKVAENGTDYSLNNTVRNVLWLPTTTEMKYKAKQAVDTLFVRLGDVSSAVLVAVLAGWLAVGVRWFAVTNIVLVAVWILVAIAIVRENKRMHAARDE